MLLNASIHDPSVAPMTHYSKDNQEKKLLKSVQVTGLRVEMMAQENYFAK